MKVQNKVMVVTGGGSGIGREMVLLLLAKGARVAAVDLNEAALQGTTELAGEKKGNLSTHVVNIASKVAVEALPDQVIAKHGAVDGVINNAGIVQPFVKLNDLGYEAIERVFNVNFFGTLYMTKTFLPHLLKRPEAHIANISSMGGFLPVPGQTIYGASKAAVKLMTEGLSSELSNTNVRVTIVFPGAMGTNIINNSGFESRALPENNDQAQMKTLAPSKAAQIIIEGIEQNKSRLLVGSDAAFMDFIYRLNPKYAAGLIYKKLKDMLA